MEIRSLQFFTVLYSSLQFFKRVADKCNSVLVKVHQLNKNYNPFYLNVRLTLVGVSD